MARRLADYTARCWAVRRSGGGSVREVADIALVAAEAVVLGGMIPGFVEQEPIGFVRRRCIVVVADGIAGHVALGGKADLHAILRGIAKTDRAASFHHVVRHK